MALPGLTALDQYKAMPFPPGYPAADPIGADRHDRGYAGQARELR